MAAFTDCRIKKKGMIGLRVLTTWEYQTKLIICLGKTLYDDTCSPIWWYLCTLSILEGEKCPNFFFYLCYMSELLFHKVLQICKAREKCKRKGSIQYEVALSQNSYLPLLRICVTLYMSVDKKPTIWLWAQSPTYFIIGIFLDIFLV